MGTTSKLFYFGTSLTQLGHYLWDLTGEHMRRSEVYRDTPFSFYDLVRGKPFGSMAYIQKFGFSVLTISGSCFDRRGGTISTFYVFGNITYEEMREIIAATPIAKKIIEQMPFEVKWLQTEAVQQG